MNIHDRATIEIRGKKIVILGLALSGAAAAKLAVRQGRSEEHTSELQSQ